MQYSRGIGICQDQYCKQTCPLRSWQKSVQSPGSTVRLPGYVTVITVLYSKVGTVQYFPVWELTSLHVARAVEDELAVAANGVLPLVRPHCILECRKTKETQSAVVLVRIGGKGPLPFELAVVNGPTLPSPTTEYNSLVLIHSKSAKLLTVQTAYCTPRLTVCVVKSTKVPRQFPYWGKSTRVQRLVNRVCSTGLARGAGAYPYALP